MNSPSDKMITVEAAGLSTLSYTVISNIGKTFGALADCRGGIGLLTAAGNPRRHPCHGVNLAYIHDSLVAK